MSKRPSSVKTTDMSTHYDNTARSDIFRSPQTPSTTSKSYPKIATPYTNAPHFSAKSDIHSRSRKRSRNDSWSLETPDSTAASPIPFANMDYHLAGGVDTPTAITSQYSTYDTSTPDASFRRGRGYGFQERNDYFHEHGGDSIRGLPGKDGNGRAPKPTYQATQTTWGSLVFGLAGKVFDFCTVGNFRGFFSGGGAGYAIKAQDAQIQSSSSTPGLGDGEWLAIPTASSSELETDDIRASKRTKTDRDDTWVMVKKPSITQQGVFPPHATHKSISPSRRPTTASTVTIGSGSKRPIATLRRTTSTRTASSAGLRSLEVGIHSVKSIAVVSQTRRNSLKSVTLDSEARRRSFATSPAISSHSRSHSSFSYYNKQEHDQAESPLASETRKHINAMRKKELAEDVDMMRMNQQLKDLIKQGKEALGTRIEVDIGEQDEWS